MGTKRERTDDLQRGAEAEAEEAVEDTLALLAGYARAHVSVSLRWTLLEANLVDA